MQYRMFGGTRWKASALGFGAMRLPTNDDKPFGRRIDKARAAEMIRYAIGHGVNYIDTAYGYHGGNSEKFLGQLLADGYREKVRIATKCPVWLVKRPAHFDKYLNEQLERLRTDHIDFYLFHALNKKVWRSTVRKHRLLKRAEAAIRDGRIGHIGFSFHDDFKAFKEIVDGYDEWSLCQIQYNYMDTNNQAGTMGLRFAASKGLAVVVMEPLLGGRLANPPKPVRSALKGRGKTFPPAELALQWVWDQKEVSLVLSGMSTMAQVVGNIRSADRSGVGSLTEERRRLVERAKKTYAGMIPIPCTKCGYCMPCPHGVDIPRNFEEYVDGYIHDDVETARMAYSRFMKKKSRASACRQCMECEAKCPQRIPISQLMAEVHAVLGKGRPYKS